MKLDPKGLNFIGDDHQGCLKTLIRYLARAGIGRMIIRFEEEEEGGGRLRVWRLESSKRLVAGHEEYIRVIAEGLLAYLSTTPALTGFGEHESRGKLTVSFINSAPEDKYIISIKIGDLHGRISRDIPSD